MLYGSCRTIEKLEDEHIGNITDTKIISDIETKRIELQAERQKFRDQRREFNKLVSDMGRRDNLYSALEESAKELPESIGNIFNDFDSVLDGYSESNNEAVLVLSDWHYGMITDNVFNVYNTEICKARVRKVVRNAIDRILLHKCRKLHIVLLGDFISGSIHVSTRVASEELVVDQLMQVSEILAQTIIELSNYVDETIVYATYGNHARTVQKEKDNIHHDNLERIIPWWIEQRVAAEEMHCGKVLGITLAQDTHSEFLFINACGVEMCAAHGDLDSVKSSPTTLTTLFHKVYGKDIDYILLGDKHHAESFEEMGVTAMICGALCGPDEYANSKRLYSEPSQSLIIVNPICGVDAVYTIKTKNTV